MGSHQFMKAVGLLCAVAGLCLAWGQGSTLLSQPAVANRALELDGNGSYLALPPRIFDGLTALTVEAWVKWDKFGPADAAFFCFGDEGQGFFAGNNQSTAQLKYALYDKARVRHPAVVTGDPLYALVLAEREWC